VIASLLAHNEGAIAATTGHIAVHEAGAIEFTGHKVLTVPGYQGKLHADDVRKLIDSFYADESFEHMVFPGLVYISHPTEYGTLYTKEELRVLSALCREKHIPLFLDGARLGYGLASLQTDVTLPDIARYCDAFTIGGTKVGALFGEAVVFSGAYRPKHFVNFIKQHGALLAKGWLTGIQFDTLFTNNLYLENGRCAIETAEMLKSVFHEAGYPFFLESPTNQQFILLTNEQAAALSQKVKYGFWERPDDAHTVVRFATSWATKPENIEILKTIL